MAKKKEQAKNEPAQQDQAAEVNAEVKTEETIPENVTLTKAEFDQVKAHIDGLQKEKEETIQMAQRLQADFDNYRKRNASLRIESLDEGAREIVRDLLPVLDNFERAMENTANVDPGYVEGIRLVHKQLLGILEKNGLEEIPADGMFDAELHNAVMQEEAEDTESGMITAVFQKGYKVKNRIIRHSMVKVAK